MRKTNAVIPSPKTLLPLAMTALLSASGPVLICQTSHGQGTGEALVKIGIDNVTGFIKSKLLAKHRLVPPVAVNGNPVYVLPLTDYDESRATDNFAAQWRGFRTNRLYILNCPDDLKRKVTFVLKGDKGGKGDSTRMDGREFGDGHEMWFDADNNYLANRQGPNAQDGDIKHILQKAPNAAVMFVPIGMTRDEALTGLKKHFEVPVSK